MSGRVGHRKRLICVNAANLRQNHLYLTGLRQHGVAFFRPNGAADCSHGWSGGVAPRPDAEPVENVVNRRTRPNGAADCSHGWSGGAALRPDAEPVESG